jgi:hypothetical protein
MQKTFDWLAALAFVLGLLFLVFLVGFFSGKNRGFLYQPLKATEETARAVWNAQFDRVDYISDGNADTPAEAGVRVADRTRMAPGATFIVGYTLEGFEAWIVDADGKKLHGWSLAFSEAFPDPEHIQYQARDLAIAWHGTHLFPNGDVLFNFQDNNFPFGSGLVKIDKDSRIVWKLPRNTHHDVAVEPDGTIWVPAQHYRPEGLPGFPHLTPWFYEDTVLKVSPEGEVQDEVSVLKAFERDQGLLTITYKKDLTVEGEDPLHLNSAEPLPAAWADRFPGLEAGDLLVSLRNVNALAVIDPDTDRVKRIWIGPFVRQHDADFMANGHLMVYDNLGGDPACGGSRILELDPADMSIVWQYDGCGHGGLASETRGMQDVLPNGNLLTIDPHRGRVLEVTRDAEPALVWEYVNVIGQEDGRPLLGMTLHAARIPESELTFLSRPVAGPTTAP